jgi:hypothetical protein
VTFHEVLDETYALRTAPLAFDEISFEWDGVPVVVRPFAWNDCALTLEGLDAGGDFARLRSWLSAWLEEHAAQPGRVEKMSPPAPSPSGARFVIDLGSAPPDAVEHLLDVAARMKPTRITLGEAR